MKKKAVVLSGIIGIFTIIWGGCSSSLGATYTAPMAGTAPIYLVNEEPVPINGFALSGTFDFFPFRKNLLEFTADMYFPKEDTGYGERQYINTAIGAYLKYPFELGPLTLYPMVGLNSVSLEDSATGPSAGIGLDIPFPYEKSLFFRVETIANFRGLQNNYGDISLTSRLTLGFNLHEILHPSVRLPDPLIPLGTTEIKNNAFRNKLGEEYRIVIIPYGVQRIGNRAFYENYDLETVVIPDTVTEIGKEAFRYCGLQKVFIPDSVKTIGKDAFNSSVALIRDSDLPGEYIGNYKVDIKNGAATITRHKGPEEIVVIPAEINGIPVTAIGKYAFFQKMLAGVTIPDTVRTIGDYAFEGNKLESLVIPDTVRTIGDYAFSRNNLKSLTLPDDVRISKKSFQDAFNMGVDSIPGVTTITTKNTSSFRSDASGYANVRINYDGKAYRKIRLIPLNERETFKVNFNFNVLSGDRTQEVRFDESFNMVVNLEKGHNYELQMSLGSHSVSWGWFWPSVNFYLTDLTTQQRTFSKSYVVEPVLGGRASLVER